MCSSLLDAIEKFKGEGLTISTLLVDLMSVIYFKHSGKIVSHVIEDFQETYFLRDRETIRALAAFRTKSDFMNILLKFGYISSLREKSHQLKCETYRIFAHFM